MKNLIYIPIALAALSCGNGENKEAEKEAIKKDYVTLSGKFTNPVEGDLVIKDYKRAYTKTISVKEDGSFSDTLKIPDSTTNYRFIYGEEFGNLFLKNGNETSFTLDTKEFDESLKFEGTSAKENNYLAAKTLAQANLDFMELMSAENENFEEDLNAEVAKMMSFIDQHKDLDASLIKAEKESVGEFKAYVQEMHASEVEKAKTLALLVGKPSPTFKDYLTPEDKNTSLSDFKGKYTYIDVWATWCGPCKAEIPSMTEFNATDAAKKINFISLSVDEEKAVDTWKEMVKEKEMTWHQLRADSAWNSSFIQAYAINSIPRFILLDPKGNVIDADAPRPSSEEFKTMIEGLEL